MTFSSSYLNCIKTYGRRAACISEYFQIATRLRPPAQKVLVQSAEGFSSKRSRVEMHGSPIRGLFS